MHTRTLVSLLGAGIVLAIPAVVSAATATGGTPQATRSATPGAGSASSTAAASPGGALYGTASAQGGRSLSLFGLENLLPGQGAALASTDSRVTRTLEVGSGTHRVTVTYGGASAALNQQANGRASAQRTTIAQPLCNDEAPPVSEDPPSQEETPFEEPPPADFRDACDPVIAFETDLTATATTRSTTLTVKVPEGRATAISVTGGIGTLVSAPRSPDRSSATARVSSVTFTSERIGA